MKILDLKSIQLVFILFFTYVGWSQETTFNYTGDVQYYTVPLGIESIRIEAAGAQGGGGLHDVIGGLGATIIGDFVVTPGEVLTISVGGQGIDGTDDTEQAGGTGGGGSFVVAA
ncbi:glycine-rich protein [Crocinitomix sp.]|nr:glycine-rich protein [Crocinitomix sp.]